MKNMTLLISCLLVIYAGAVNSSPARVVNGDDAKLGQFPYIVLIEYQIKATNGDRNQLCGGSILKEDLILSAAHCFDEFLLNMPIDSFNFFVRAGIVDQKSESGQTVAVKKHWNHPKYQVIATTGYDISVLLLESKLAFNDNVKPIPLPRPNELFDTGKVITVGWGRVHESDTNIPAPDHLQYAIIDLLPLSECRALINGSFSRVFEHEVCAHGPKLKASSCYGDSGGPLVKENPTVLVGVTSRLTKNILCNEDPVVYTGVSCFIDFIQEAEGQLRAS